MLELVSCQEHYEEQKSETERLRRKDDMGVTIMLLLLFPVILSLIVGMGFAKPGSQLSIISVVAGSIFAGLALIVMCVVRRNGSNYTESKNKLDEASIYLVAERLGVELMLNDDEIPKMRVDYGTVIKFKICYITFNHDISTGEYWILGYKDTAPVSTSFIEVWEHIYDEVTTNGYM